MTIELTAWIDRAESPTMLRRDRGLEIALSDIEISFDTLVRFGHFSPLRLPNHAPTSSVCPECGDSTPNFLKSNRHCMFAVLY
jgi:hypothetical protein